MTRMPSIAAASAALAAGGQREAQRAPHRAHLAVEAELSHEDPAHGGVRTHSADPQEADGDRQVERRAALAKVGRGQVDGDGAGRKREPSVAERRSDALPRLAYGGVRQPHDRESRQAVGGVDLDVEHASLETERRGGVNAGEHETSSEPREA